MIKIIAEYVLRMRASKYVKANERKHSFVNYAKAQNILLLFESDETERNDDIRKMIAELKHDGKKVSAWGYLNKKDVATSILPDFRILHQKQADFYGHPALSFVNELENQEFDLLIDLTVNRVVTLEYIALYARALFKTGTRQTAYPLYDFLLDVSSQPATPETADDAEESKVPVLTTRYLFDQIIFYLKRIQTND